MRCCANCEWCISKELEEEIIEEQGYNEEDFDRPHAGDCSLGMKHDENYYCSFHHYIEGMEEYENEVYYDEQYLAHGYLIISKLDGEIMRYIKISSYGEGGYPKFIIRGYEKNSKDKPEQHYRNIYFTIKRNEPLYKPLCIFANNLNQQVLYSIDPSEQGKNHLEINCDREEAIITLSKDVYGVKNATDFIDINLGDNDSCKNYEEVNSFYNNLSSIALKSNQDEIKKILSI